MKLIQFFCALTAAGVLAGCAAGPRQSDSHVHSAQSSTGTTDRQAMCAKHQKMMAGKSSGEQHAMMQEQMMSMSPEMRQRMQAMHEKCR
ncbi:MAG: hypothetical protein EOO54_10700 [Haliea sp.]|nr:MAG: hypothetical protein EOO54_10700 [Haliea sp.]